MYKIKDLKPYNIIPSDEFYNNEEWYQYVRPVLKKVIMSFFGERDLMIEDSLIRGNLDKIKDGSFIPDIAVDYVKDIIDSLFLMKNQSYNRIYDALFSEYNPLWNVDGTETLTYTKDNTGTQANDTTRTGNVTDNVALVGSEQNQNIKSGNMVDATTYAGQQSNVRSGSTDSQVSPEDNNNFYNTNRELYNNITDTQSFNNRMDTSTETYNNVTDTNTRSFTNRADNRTTTYNSVKDEGIRTDRLKEQYTETKVRHGNIGVTKSTELVESEVVLRDKYNFVEIVAKDVVNIISYMC